MRHYILRGWALTQNYLNNNTLKNEKKRYSRKLR